MKPLTLYWGACCRNGMKALVILEELGVPYETTWVSYHRGCFELTVFYDELKEEPYTNINPNGRLPAIHDPNTEVTLWESGAIVYYLIDQYDKEQKLTYTTVPEKYLLQQYSYFQASGQDPSFEQAREFNHFHRERLVGDKCTYADLSFVMWNVSIVHACGVKGAPVGFEMEKYPNFKSWQARMVARPSVKKVLENKLRVSISSPGTLE